MKATGEGLRGSCHCGTIEITYHSRVPPAESEVRACACSFCRRHGARCISDPEGSLVVTAAGSGKLKRYRFALGTAEYLVCADCGVYVGAVMTEGAKAYGILNINVLDDPSPFTQAPASVTYDAEDEAGRRARRRARWTPVEQIREPS